MRFLADENVMVEIIEELRQIGHDVIAAAEVMRSASDPDVLARAKGESCILITADQDFGDLVIRQGLQVEGIVLLELHQMTPQNFARRSVNANVAAGEQLRGAFTVIEPARIRRR